MSAGPFNSLRYFSWFDFLAGFVNLGNTCFVNAGLQALAASSTFELFLQDLVDHFRAMRTLNRIVLASSQLSSSQSDSPMGHEIKLVQSALDLSPRAVRFFLEFIQALQNCLSLSSNRNLKLFNPSVFLQMYAYMEENCCELLAAQISPSPSSSWNSFVSQCIALLPSLVPEYPRAPDFPDDTKVDTTFTDSDACYLPKNLSDELSEAVLEKLRRYIDSDFAEEWLLSKGSSLIDFRQQDTHEFLLQLLSWLSSLSSLLTKTRNQLRELFFSFESPNWSGIVPRVHFSSQIVPGERLLSSFLFQKTQCCLKVLLSVHKNVCVGLQSSLLSCEKMRHAPLSRCEEFQILSLPLDQTAAIFEVGKLVQAYQSTESLEGVICPTCSGSAAVLASRTDLERQTWSTKLIVLKAGLTDNLAISSLPSVRVSEFFSEADYFSPFSVHVPLLSPSSVQSSATPVRVPCSKSLRLVRLPALLLLHINRTTMTGVKVSARVRFSLSLSSRAIVRATAESPCPASEAAYQLISVVQHIGSGIDQGHYVTFKLVKGEWFLMDDARVTQVSVQHVLDCQAYILLYQRK